MSLMSVVCCQIEVSATGDYSSGGVLLSMVLLNVISKPRQWGGSGSLWLSSHVKKISCTVILNKIFTLYYYKFVCNLKHSWLSGRRNLAESCWSNWYSFREVIPQFSCNVNVHTRSTLLCAIRIQFTFLYTISLVPILTEFYSLCTVGPNCLILSDFPYKVSIYVLFHPPYACRMSLSLLRLISHK